MHIIDKENIMVLFFIGGIFFVLGAFFLVIIMIVKKYYDDIYTRCTSTVEGIVDGIYEKTQDENDLENISHEYYPIYKYVVNGKEYFCRGIKGSYNSKSIKKENKLVHYNPSNPSESYVEKDEIDFIIKIFEILGIIFSSIGLFLIFLQFILKK